MQKPILRSSGVASRSSRMATRSLPLHHKPAVALWIRRREPEHRHGRTVGQRLAQFRKRLRPHQRRIGEHHQNIVGAAGDRLARRQNGMGGAAPFALLKNLRLWRDPARLRR